MSEGEKVYRVRNKQTGRCAYCSDDPSGYHFEYWVNACDGTVFTSFAAVETLFYRDPAVEFVEFTLSNPRVVEQL